METKARENDPLNIESAALRVLGIAELVDIIFTFSNRPDNARNARVCKTWSEIALKMIWTEVNDLHALFSILAPLTPGDNAQHYAGVYSFSQLPSAARWRRFEAYAMLVRTLVYHPIPGIRKDISRAVLRDIAQTRTRLDIFPNLHTLKWFSPTMYRDVDQPDIPIPSDSLLFMHAGIQTLQLYLHRSLPVPQIKEFLDDIPYRTMCLTEIDVLTAVSVVELEANVRALLRHLPALQRVHLPKGYLTSRIANALSASPALRALQIGTKWDRWVNVASLAIPAGGFLALRKLEVAVSLADAALLIDAVTTENGLGDLIISSPNPSIEDFKQILQICANKHDRITRLDLKCYDDELELVEHFPLTFQTILSLMKLSFLTVLEISYPSPIFISLAEFVSMLPSLTQLTRLGLNESPLYCETASFGLDILPIIARSCKHLTTLKLFLDATLPLPGEEPYIREGFFVKLNYLDLGVSVIDEETCHSTAMFLSSQLPLGCKLDFGAGWIEDNGRHQQLVDIASKRCYLWEQVTTLLSV